ncbi:NAD(P)H-binding protein [Chitinophaga sp. XS-30]|uniref:NmrA family NAD(P)-binding protein n=1 Tax=Chitinophaga sp. XS-30 TaxID=2604421 RepID=UPI0011DD98C8|nr:NAD(P)H-binding protein [Chitinophaga sp. XS-30]QEH40473.1 NAD(P)H-binding protein [Chitinophaga sp. XS-30]
MKITIAGSLGNIGKPLTLQLVAAGHDVTVISSNADRKADIAALGASAAIGSVSDAAFLQETFRGADAVFAMTPPGLGGVNVVANTTAAGRAYATAIREAGVTRVVMLSSVGADHPDGNGPIAGVHNIEQLFNDLEGVAVTILRAGLFYTNFYNNVPLIKGMGIMGANYPASLSLPLVHPKDIAAAAAEELQRPATGKNIRYIVSDIRTPADFAKVLGAAAGKPELPWVEFTDEQSLQGMLQAGLTEEIAGLYTEMGAGFRSGRLLADFKQNGAPVTGRTRLEDFAKEFAGAF